MVILPVANLKTLYDNKLRLEICQYNDSRVEIYYQSVYKISHRSTDTNLISTNIYFYL